MTTGRTLLAPKDAAQRLGVTTSRVQQLAREGKLREIRDSQGRRLFRPEDVERLRRQREAERRVRTRKAAAQAMR
ncbi:MAG: MerR family transcriptional regulator [Armatimonadota bacterium]|nr:MerR family transcriptional regulator [Armatimonadota bacterium]